MMRHTTDSAQFKKVIVTCHDRFCIPCGQARVSLLQTRLGALLHDKPHRFLTLTIRHDQEPLTFLLNKLYRSFRRLRASAMWKERVRGGAAFLEVTYNPDRQSWHPHLHVILEGDFLPKADIKATWLRVTGDSANIDIRLIRSRQSVIRYCAKYAAKPLPSNVTFDAPRLREALESLRGRKLINQFGTWVRWQLTRPIDDDDWEWYAWDSDIRTRANHGEPLAIALMNAIGPTPADGETFEITLTGIPPPDAPEQPPY